MIAKLWNILLQQIPINNSRPQVAGRAAILDNTQQLRQSRTTTSRALHNDG